MNRPSTRAVVLGVAALLLVAAAGVVGYLRTGAEQAARAASTVRVDGVDHACGAHGVVRVGITVTGPSDARFTVDGVEVPTQRTVASPDGPPSSTALLPAPLQSLRCDDGALHRFTALTDTPQQCRWTLDSEQTQEEARGHQHDLTLSGTACTVTVLD